MATTSSSSASSSAKQSLQKRLANILNVSHDDDPDYLSDILDQLVEMADDPEDVVAYLSSFVVDDTTVGGSNDVVRGSAEGEGGSLEAFARDVRRWRDGEILEVELRVESSSPAIAADVSDESHSHSAAAASSSSRGVLDEMAAQREEFKRRENEARERQRKEQELWKRKKREEEERKRRAWDDKRRMPPESKWGVSKSSNDGGKLSKKFNNNNNNNNNNVRNHGKIGKKQPQPIRDSPSSSRDEKQPPMMQQSQRPPKGKPQKICGCYGNKHDPLANCLHCGRISCVYEGYDYCAFCENLIVPGNANANDSAQAHKNRLLEFDRTTAERTRIHDDQEDYFVTGTSMWSTVEEQESAKELEEERTRRLHARGNQVLELDL